MTNARMGVHFIWEKTLSFKSLSSMELSYLWLRLGSEKPRKTVRSCRVPPMRIVNKPWGYEEIFAETDSYVGKILVINPGHRLSRQYHNLKEETFRVLSGTLILEIDEDDIRTPYIMKSGDVYHCAPGTIHRMICDKDEPKAVQVVEVSTNHLDDVVRLEDDYNR